MEKKITIHINDDFLKLFRRPYSRGKIAFWAAVTLVSAATLLYASPLVKPFDFTDGTIISASQMNQNFDVLYAKVNELDQKWPEGSYCILANGSCPAGFSRAQGHIMAIRNFAADDAYLRQANFGDSYIHCHGSCGQFPDNYAELSMTTCCK